MLFYTLSYNWQLIYECNWSNMFTCLISLFSFFVFLLFLISTHVYTSFLLLITLSRPAVHLSLLITFSLFRNFDTTTLSVTWSNVATRNVHIKNWSNKMSKALYKYTTTLELINLVSGEKNLDQFKKVSKVTYFQL